MTHAVILTAFPSAAHTYRWAFGALAYNRQRRKAMLKKLFEIRDSEGEEAAEKWANSLSEKDRNLLFYEINQHSETMAAAVGNLSNAIVNVFNEAFLPIKKLAEEFQKIR